MILTELEAVEITLDHLTFLIELEKSILHIEVMDDLYHLVDVTVDKVEAALEELEIEHSTLFRSGTATNPPYALPIGIGSNWSTDPDIAV